MKIKLHAVLSFLFTIQAFAFEVEQVFLESRETRGNVNLIPLQDIDYAAWIWLPQVKAAHGAYTPFVRFRKDFSAMAEEPLRLDVSADARFVLMLDGREIARGPHKGTVNHWYYESYLVKGLKSGSHRLEAVVFDPGEKGALSILSSGRNGFILKAAGAYDSQLTSGKAKWQAAEVTSIRYGCITDPQTMTGAETISSGIGFLESVPEKERWRDAVVVRLPVTVEEYGFHRLGWALFPTERPDPMRAVRTCGTIRAVQNGKDASKSIYKAADADDARVEAFQSLLSKAAQVTVPAQTRLRVLWDLGNYYCAYPVVKVSGGKDAKIRWAWTEGLYDDSGSRGDRNQFIGKRVAHSMDDTFLCDGREGALFTTPWWRSGRWVEIDIETNNDPLRVEGLAIDESRYPMEPRFSFECDDPTLTAVQQLCVRGMQCCMHEMFMDCPYFEQQMYPGDTRVEMLVLNAISGDDRLIRFGAGIFDYARRDDGMVPMNFPSRNIQDSATYSMCWAMMFGDYVRWHGTNAWLRARIPGLRHTMSVIGACENAEGLVEGLPGWSFMDWVPEWDKYGNAPDGRRGLSALNNLLYVHALRSIAHTEEALGDRVMSDYWMTKAKRTADAIVRRFWCEKRKLLADTIAKDCFSEHAQCLALLADVLPDDKAKLAFDRLLSDQNLARTTVYFSHYLFETYLKFARADVFLKRLDLWRDYVKIGLKTPLEAPGVRARSDCHAWGAHPLYHLVTGIAGIRPSEDGYAKVEIAPQPGGLGFIKSTAPTPKGMVCMDLKFHEGTVKGSVALPKGLDGVFRWKNVRMPLKSGTNKIDIDGR